MAVTVGSRSGTIEQCALSLLTGGSLPRAPPGFL